jgi:hypothetical protein
MDILVPTDKPELPHRTGMINIVQTLAVFGWVAYVLFFAMVFSEGNVSFPHLQRTLVLVGTGFAGFLVTWRYQRIGGLIILASMIVALVLTPSQLKEWRVWFYALEIYMAIVGLLFILVPRKNHGRS